MNMVYQSFVTTTSAFTYGVGPGIAVGSELGINNILCWVGGGGGEGGLMHKRADLCRYCQICQRYTIKILIILTPKKLL